MIHVLFGGKRPIFEVLFSKILLLEFPQRMDFWSDRQKIPAFCKVKKRRLNPRTIHLWKWWFSIAIFINANHTEKSCIWWKFAQFKKKKCITTLASWVEDYTQKIVLMLRQWRKVWTEPWRKVVVCGEGLGMGHRVSTLEMISPHHESWFKWGGDSIVTGSGLWIHIFNPQIGSLFLHTQGMALFCLKNWNGSNIKSVVSSNIYLFQDVQLSSGPTWKIVGWWFIVSWLNSIRLMNHVYT